MISLKISTARKIGGGVHYEDSLILFVFRLWDAPGVGLSTQSTRRDCCADTFCPPHPCERGKREAQLCGDGQTKSISVLTSHKIPTSRTLLLTVGGVAIDCRGGLILHILLLAPEARFKWAHRLSNKISAKPSYPLIEYWARLTSRLTE